MAEAATSREEYFVTEDCIACDACCNEFPDIFKMNAEHTRALAVNPSPVGKFNPWDIIEVCPVNAIQLTNLPMPARPEADHQAKSPAEEALPAVPADWEERWLQAKDEIEPQWERMKRYGMASMLEEEASRYIWRFDMPDRVPQHRLKFQWGLPDRMPDYKTSVEVKGRHVQVKARLEDPRLRKLCGWINSFPEGFLRELTLAHPIKSHKTHYDPETRVFEVSLEKD